MITSPTNSSRKLTHSLPTQQSTNHCWCNTHNLYSATLPHAIDTLQCGRDPCFVWFKSTNCCSSLLCSYTHTECICHPSIGKQSVNHKKVKCPASVLRTGMFIPQRKSCWHTSLNYFTPIYKKDFETFLGLCLSWHARIWLTQLFWLSSPLGMLGASQLRDLGSWKQRNGPTA